MIESRSFAVFFVREAIVTPAGAYGAPPRIAIAVSGRPVLWRTVGMVGICGATSRGRAVSMGAPGAAGTAIVGASGVTVGAMSVGAGIGAAGAIAGVCSIGRGTTR